jgi:formate/nitrite transporter FocA (FNT family)
MLFSLALLAIIKNNLLLYTGRIGFAINKRHTLAAYCLMLLMNLFGSMITVLFWFTDNNTKMEELMNIAYTKFDQPYIKIFISGFLCGILMYIAVKSKNELITVFCIMTFILSGFDHCIADFPYLAFLDIEPEYIIKFALVVLGNSLGSILTNIFIEPAEE